MQILFKPLTAKAADMHAHALHRVSFALRRFAGRIPRATVQLSDVNGPRGGIDKRCQIELKTTGTVTVITSDVASNWRTAIDHALARAVRFLARLARKQTSSRRRRPRDRSEAPSDQ